jgi:hypothetical protein
MSKLIKQLTNLSVLSAGGGGLAGVVLAEFLFPGDRATAGIAGGAIGSSVGTIIVTRSFSAIAESALAGAAGGLVAGFLTTQAGNTGLALGGLSIYLSNAVVRAYI